MRTEKCRDLVLSGSHYDEEEPLIMFAANSDELNAMKNEL